MSIVTPQRTNQDVKQARSEKHSTAPTSPVTETSPIAHAMMSESESNLVTLSAADASSIIESLFHQTIAPDDLEKVKWLDVVAAVEQLQGSSSIVAATIWSCVPVSEGLVPSRTNAPSVIDTFLTSQGMPATGAATLEGKAFVQWHSRFPLDDKFAKIVEWRCARGSNDETEFACITEDGYMCCKSVPTLVSGRGGRLVRSSTYTRKGIPIVVTQAPEEKLKEEV